MAITSPARTRQPRGAPGVMAAARRPVPDIPSRPPATFAEAVELADLVQPTSGDPTHMTAAAVIAAYQERRRDREARP